MFQDSNKEYTGSSAGVAGTGPATPISLSATQEIAAQAAAAAAFEQLQRQQQIADTATTRAQLYEVVRQMVESKQQSVDPTVVIDRWHQSMQDASHAAKATPPVIEKPTDVQARGRTLDMDQDSDSANRPRVQVAPVAPVEPKTPEATLASDVHAEQADELASVGGEGINSSAETTASPEGDQSVSGSQETVPVSSESNLSGVIPEETSDTGQQAVSQPQTATPSGLGNNSVANPEAQDGSKSGVGQETSSVAGSSDQPSTTAEKTDSGQPGAASDSAADATANSSAPGAEPSSPTQSGNVGTTSQSSAAPVPVAKEQEPALSSNTASEAGKPEPDLQGKPVGSKPEKQGLPTGKRDRFKRGLEDRKSGESFKNAYGARKLPPGGSAVKGLGKGAAKEGAKNIAKEGAKDVAKTAAKAVAKEGAKDIAKVASKSNPVTGLLTDVDLKGTIKAAKDLKNLKVGSAAKNVVQSGAITLLRVSYDPWVVGFTIGLSLIVTLLVGSVMFFVPGSSMTFLERLLIVALWLLLLFIVLLVFGLILVTLCNGPVGWGIWAASWFSKTAADINKFCEPISGLQQAAKVLK